MFSRSGTILVHDHILSTLRSCLIWVQLFCRCYPYPVVILIHDGSSFKKLLGGFQASLGPPLQFLPKDWVDFPCGCFQE